MTQPVGNSLYSVANGTTSSNVFIAVITDRAPTSNDYNFPVQKRWINSVTGEEYFLLNFTSTGGVVLANWIQISAGTTITETLTGNSGGAVGPDGSQNINVLGDATSINITGNPATNTLTANVILPATDHVTLVGETSSISGIGPGTAGQVYLSGGASADPAFVTPTAGTGLSVTTNATSLEYALTTPVSIADGGTNATSFTQTNGIVTYNGTSLVNYAGPQIDSSGRYTNSTQPAFLAYASSADNNVTGDGTAFVIGSGNALTIVANRGSNFTAQGVFTAPVTGLYQFNSSIRTNNQGVAATSFIIQIVTSNGVYSSPILNPSSLPEPSSNSICLNLSILADMDVNDTATLRITISGTTKTIGVAGSNRDTMFSGYLVE